MKTNTGYSIRVRVTGLHFREQDLDTTSKLRVVQMRIKNDSSMLSIMRSRSNDSSNDFKGNHRMLAPFITIERLYGGYTIPIDRVNASSIDSNNSCLDFEISGIKFPPTTNGERPENILLRLIRTKLEGRSAYLPFLDEKSDSLKISAVIDANPGRKTSHSVYRNEELFALYETWPNLPNLGGLNLFNFIKAGSLIADGGFIPHEDMENKLNIALMALSPFERRIILHSYRVANEPILTSAELAESMGVDESWIKQTKKSAIRLLTRLNYTRNYNLQIFRENNVFQIS